MNKQSIRLGILLLVVVCCLFLIAQTSQAQSAVNVFVHWVEIEPIVGKLKYQVELFVSVWEGDGNPIADLKVSDFSVQQDSKAVNIETVDIITDEPSSVILVIDSSRWTSIRMAEVQKAANEIVNRLTAGDRIAVVDFNSKVNVVSGFTEDLNAVRSAINSISSSQEGTCLFDGLTKSLEMIQSEPIGRRAVIVFSAGKDVLYSDIPCSTNKEDQVLQLAINGNSRIPIYTIGSSESMDIIDRQRYNRFATLTGGISIMPTDFKINTFIEKDLPKILNQIKVQYRLTFKTDATSGEHQFSVKAGIRNSIGQGNFLAFFPDLPPLIQFDTPKENETIAKSVEVAITLLGKTDTVSAVRLELNGTEIDVLEQPPYEFSVDLSTITKGVQELKAIAVDAKGNPLAEKMIHITVSNNSDSAAPSPDNSQSQPDTLKFTLPETILGIKSLWMVVGFTALTLVIAAGIILFSRKTIKKNTPPSTAADITLDGLFVASEIATLSVLFSDDPLRIGEKFPLINSFTTIGRYSDNNIVFDKDMPVSRHHIQIEKNGPTFVLSEVIGKFSSNSVPKYPSYGTFINDTQIVHGERIKLRCGDEIRLGTRLKLVFEAPQSNSPTSVDSDATLDEFETGEITQEGI